MADIRMTEEQLNNIVSAAVTSALKGARPAESPEAAITRDPEELLRQIRSRKAIRPNQYIPCKSPITGATFVAVVAYSRTFPAGRVLDLRDYTFPDGVDRHEPSPLEIERNNGVMPEGGGKVPTGMLMKHPDGTETVAYKQWKYETFSLADRRLYASGAKFQNALRAGADLPIPETELTPAERDAKEIVALDKAHPVTA
jgi:hypothetical protein